MAQSTINVNTILAHPSFRNGAHLVGNIVFSYILLRLVLYILDTRQIGLEWLQTHQNSGFLVIISLIIFLLLSIDVVISRGRRHYRDEKYSLAEIGYSYIKDKVAARRTRQRSGLAGNARGSLSGIIETGISSLRARTTSSKTRSVRPGLTENDISSLSDMIGTVNKEDFMRQKRMTNPILKPIKEDISVGGLGSLDLSEIQKDSWYAKETKQVPKKTERPASLDIAKKTSQMPFRTPEKPTPVIEDLAVGSKSGKSQTTVDKKPSTQPPKIVTPKFEEPKRLGALISESKLSQEPETNIKYKDVISVKLDSGRRVIKSLDSPHSISVIDFRSRITSEEREIKVELLKRSSRLAVPIKGKHKIVYEFINIWINEPEDNLEDPSIRFNVRREWIASNNILTVQLQQFVNGDWNIIPTKRIGQDTTHLFYEAFVPVVSAPFAIVGTAL